MQERPLRPSGRCAANFLVVIAYQQNRLLRFGIQQAAKTCIAAQQIIQPRTYKIIAVDAYLLRTLSIVTTQLIVGHCQNI